MGLLSWAPKAARLVLAVSVLLGWSGSGVGAQTLSLADRGPRFLLASSSRAALVEIDAGSSAMLRRVVSLDMEQPTVGGLLESIERQTGLRFAFDRGLVPVAEPVALRAEAITVAAALTAILGDTEVDVLLSSGRQVALVKRLPRPAPVQEGSIVGRVTDKTTGSPLGGAAVAVEETRYSGTTDTDGRYRIAGVEPGRYTVRVRYIGYAPLSASVVVSVGAEVEANFTLERSTQTLDEVVVTGTLIPTEVKALPTPVTVINADDISMQAPRTINEVFRQAVPSAVAWEPGGFPYQTPLSVRGAGSLTSGGSSVKVLVDGVEVADPSLAAIDPGSIERIEVIRGPQASTIYGSNAIGGVMQISTKQGDSGLRRPQIDAQAGLGTVQSPYGDFGTSTALRQEYSASVRGGVPSATYSFGGGYKRTGEWVPEGTQSLGSAYGSMHVGQGPLGLDVSARYYVIKNSTMVAPDVATTWSFFATPFYGRQTARAQAYGLRLSFTPTARWRHSVVAGIDRLPRETVQSQPRLTTPEDTLLEVSYFESTRTSISYNTSLLFDFDPGLSASFTGGVDYWLLRNDGHGTPGALNTTGSIRTDPSLPLSATRTRTTNSGYFGQAQLDWRDALFLTAGLRAEQNSDLGSGVGTELAPRLGVSYVHQFGQVTAKLRTSYGEAIRPPAPGYKDAIGPGFGAQLASPLLEAERQHGWDAGVDFILGTRGSLSATYYHQVASDLINLVVVDPETQSSQYQNVGRVKNTGAEFEAGLRVGAAQIRAQYAITRSRPEALGPAYTGDLRVGEQVFQVPEHTAGASLSFAPFQDTRVAAGLTYLGSWTNYDFLAFFSCIGGTGPCRPSFRDYLIEYPGFVKFNLSLVQQLTSVLSGFVSVNNLTDVGKSELLNSTPVMGRVTVVGMRARY